MQYTEIQVVFAEDLLRSGLERLEGMPGLRVQLIYPMSQRAVVALEAGTSESQLQGLRSIRALPQVIAADVRIGYRRPTQALSKSVRRPGMPLEPV